MSEEDEEGENGTRTAQEGPEKARQAVSTLKQSCATFLAAFERREVVALSQVLLAPLSRRHLTRLASTPLKDARYELILLNRLTATRGSCSHARARCCDLLKARQTFPPSTGRTGECWYSDLGERAEEECTSVWARLPAHGGADDPAQLSGLRDGPDERCNLLFSLAPWLDRRVQGCRSRLAACAVDTRRATTDTALNGDHPRLPPSSSHIHPHKPRFPLYPPSTQPPSPTFA